MDNQLGVVTETLSDDVFDKLMGSDSGDGTIGTNDILGGTSEPVIAPVITKKKSDTQKDTANTTNTNTATDTNTFDDGIQTEPLRTDEDVVSDIDSMLDIDDNTSGNTNQNNGSTGNNNSHSSVLKAQYEYLVEKGFWDKVETVDEADFEFDDDSFSDLAEKQAQWKVDKVYQSKLDKAGIVGKTIINHIEKGGDPNEIISLFQEKETVNKIDISTEAGQSRILDSYYKSLGWSETRVQRYIKTVIDTGDIKNEAEELKALMDKEIDEEIVQIQQEQEEYNKQQKERVQKFSQTMTSAVNELTELDEREKREILADVLVYDKKLGDGRVVNQFTKDFITLQQDPKKYINLIRYVKNPDLYEKIVAKKQDSKAVKKAWSWIKDNGSLSGSTGTSHVKTKSNNNGDDDLKIDWKAIRR